MPATTSTRALVDGAFARRYGPWALIVGASAGLGAAFADAIARRGLNLIMVARRADVLDSSADVLRARYGVDVVVGAIDVGANDAADRIIDAIAERDVGLVVMNAAAAPVGDFVDADAADVARAVDVNCRTPLVLVNRLVKPLVAQKRGGVILMSSMAGLQGSPRLATYSATKAFLIAFGEALWAELKPHGVDVVACIAGAIRTPNYLASQTASAEPPGTLDPDVVANQALGALGAGPRVIPGGANRLAAMVMGLLPRSVAVTLMGRNTKDLK